MSPEPSPDQVNTQNRNFTSRSIRVLTQYYSVLSKKTPVLSKHSNIHKYIKSACRALSTQAVMDKYSQSTKGKIYVIRTIRTCTILMIWLFCNFQNTFPLCLCFPSFYIKANFVLCVFFLLSSVRAPHAVPLHNIFLLSCPEKKDWLAVVVLLGRTDRTFYLQPRGQYYHLNRMVKEVRVTWG